MKQKFHALSAILIVMTLLFSLPGSAQAGANASLQLAPGSNNPDGLQAGQSTYIVFYDQTFNYTYYGGPVCLSSQDGQCSQPAIDDAVIIYVNGNKVVDVESNTNGFGPIDFSQLLQIGNNQIRVQLIDLLGPTMGGSALWLVPTNSSECVRVDFAPLQGETPPLATSETPWTKHEIIFKYEFSGNVCPDVPFYPTIGEDPSLTIESDYGQVSVNLKGEIDIGPGLDKNQNVFPFFGAELNKLFPLRVYTVYLLKKDEAKAIDFNLTSQRKIGDRVTIKPPTEALAYVIAISVSYREQIVKFGVQIIPYVRPVLQQLLQLARFAVVRTLKSNPVSEIQSTTINAVPSPDVIDDLNYYFGSEFVSAAQVNSLDIAGASIKGPGQNIKFNGSGFTPNSQTYVALTRVGDTAPTIETEVLSRANGTVSGSFRLPLDAKPGRWLVSVVDAKLLYDQLQEVVNGDRTDIQPYLAANTVVVPNYTIVKIDIKPGSKKNPINLKSRGNIPVAILGTANFNVKLVNPLTLQFGPDAAAEAHLRGHGSNGKKDLMLHFKTPLTGIISTDKNACVFGQLTNGDYIFGCDKITIVPKK